MSLNVLFLEPQPCIRALKYARGLKWASHNKIRITFGHLFYTLNDLYGQGDEIFDELVKLNMENLHEDIEKLVKRIEPDVIHSHNAPDFLTVLALDAVKGEVPVIHDCHEALTMRKTGYYVDDDEETIRVKYPMQEKVANERSNGRIYVTEGVRDYIQQRYDVDPSKDIVFYSYVSESVMPTKLRRKISEKDDEIHMVYIGTVTSRIKDSHYDLREIFRNIASHGIHVHMYVSIWGMKDKAYQRLGEEDELIHFHGHLDQTSLLDEITQYDFGWAGLNVNPKNRKHLDVSLPNKVFEYVACGLPVLAFKHENMMSFLNQHNVGFVFDNMDEMASKLQNLDDVKSIKETVLDKRYEFTVEKNIDRLIQYYKEISSL
jgi:glycosyltransferase involved in cell wall biosynthesis